MAESKCSFSSEPKILLERENIIVKVWTEKFKKVFESSNLVDDHNFDTYRFWVETKTDTDQILLLKRQRELYAQYFPDCVPRFDKLIAGEIGEIKEINCLESLLVATHNNRYPLKNTPSEFGGYYLIKKQNDKVNIKIYFTSNNVLSVNPSEMVENSIKEDIKTGWKVIFHIHNHPFIFSNTSGDYGGTIIPSGDKTYGDVSVFIKDRKKFGIKNALITNGFDTIYIDSKEFDQL